MSKGVRGFVQTGTSRRLFLLFCILGFAAGCQKPFLHSKVPEVVSTNATATALQVRYSVSVQELANYSATTPYSCEVGRFFSLHSTQLPTNDLNSFLQSLNAGITQTVWSCGARLHGDGGAFSSGALRQYAFSYEWLKNEGLIRVYCASTDSNRVEIMLFCYEHLR